MLNTLAKCWHAKINVHVEFQAFLRVLSTKNHHNHNGIAVAGRLAFYFCRKTSRLFWFLLHCANWTQKNYILHM